MGWDGGQHDRRECFTKRHHCDLPEMGFSKKTVNVVAVNISVWAALALPVPPPPIPNRFIQSFGG